MNQDNFGIFLEVKSEMTILIRSHLDSCLLTDKELATQQWKKGYKDDWPVERAYPSQIK